MSHGSRHNSDRLLEMVAAVLAWMLGISFAASTAPVAVVVLGWVLVVGGSIWMVAVHERR